MRISIDENNDAIARGRETTLQRARFPMIFLPQQTNARLAAYNAFNFRSSVIPRTVIHDDDFEDLVTTAHVIASEFDAKGFGPQLLAALFPFEGNFKEKRVFWIYGFKPGAFWPFIPTGKGQERDNAEELELKAKMEKELPIEQDLTRWFGLFDAPV